MLGISNGITNHVLEENLEHSTGLLVDETADSLNSTTSGETANRRLGDSLNVIPQNLTVTLGSSLSETLSSLSTYIKTRQ